MIPRTRKNQIGAVLPLVWCIASGMYAQQAPPRPDESRLAYQVFLLGNTGAESSDKLQPTLTLLKSKLSTAGENSAVVFLGDLLPCCGMPDSGATGRAEAEQRLMMLVETVRNFKGQVYFIPGDQDWGEEENVGWQSLLRMEAFIENALARGNVFIPDGGFPGPEEKKLTSDIRLIALNTQWLLTRRHKATGDAGDNEAEEDDEVYVELEDLIHKRATKDLIVLGHHPLYSNGRYGGHYHPRAHLFPLTLWWQGGYVPLPIIGTLALTFKRNIGDEQYFAHERNLYMRQSIDRILRLHEDFVYASAHEYSLQLFKSHALNKMQKYLVSGSAAASEYAAQGHKSSVTKTMFIDEAKGFSLLHYYDDGALWADFWISTDDGSGRLLREDMLREPREAVDQPAVASDDGAAYANYRDSTITLAVEPSYQAGWLQRFLVGSNHREVWTTPATVPYFDIGKERGGLQAVKRGGGLQTISLRLAAADGKEYVLRSVNKDGRRFLPEELQYTFVAPISQDFLSYSHPYGALIVPELAEAIGVYHTNPKLVYVPSDPRFGQYQKLVANMLMLYEERPHKDMSDSPWFGNSKDVVSSSEMFREVTRNNDSRVDARAHARVRLFDMWMSDWDRHKDQWRWASYGAPQGKGKIYQPIPRDRDQAFNRLNFFGHRLIKPFLKFQDYRNSYGSLKGLTFNGRDLDHRYLNELTREAWAGIADSVRTALTDEVIEKAFKQWPEPIYALQGEEMIEIGKVRRDQLTAVADKFYRLHARSVDVVGSNKNERFEITRHNDDETEVVMFKTSSKGEIERELYRRMLHRGETKEVCLYGLGGDDQFIMKGEVGKGITIHAIGGTGNDSFVDSSRVRSGGKKNRFYDSEAGNLKPGPQTALKITDDPFYNEYSGFFEFPRTYPFAAAWYTSDDGVILLGGAAIKEHSFKKQPYARQHTFSGSIATEPGALKFNYGLTFRQTFGRFWHTSLGTDYGNNNNFRNFYGLGNETSSAVSPDSARIFMGSFDFEIPFRYESVTGWTFEAAPKVNMTNVRDDQRPFDHTQQPGLSAFTTDTQWFAGARFGLDLKYQDDRDNPRHGYRWPTTLDANGGIKNASDAHARLESALSLYASPWLRRQITLGLRIGGAHNLGTFPFHASNTLSGTTNLRGYRKDRFSGRTSLYANTDLRVGVFNIGGDLLPGTLGLVGFFDVGRVWTDQEHSSKWHPGYGGGIWYDFVGEVVLCFTVGHSNEDNTFLFGPGFFF
ncbi:MAG: hypothetical protein ACREOO_24360 [bacterium]